MHDKILGIYKRTKWNLNKKKMNYQTLIYILGLTTDDTAE